MRPQPGKEGKIMSTGLPDHAMYCSFVGSFEPFAFVLSSNLLYIKTVSLSHFQRMTGEYSIDWPL